MSKDLPIDKAVSQKYEGEGSEIAELAARCRLSFEETSKILPDALRALNSHFTAADLEDVLEQFRVWARNTGAFAHDEASLDYRLREATTVQRTILSLLQQIEERLTECVHVTTSASEDEEFNDDSDSSSNDLVSDDLIEEKKQSRREYEIRARLEDIGNFLDNLLKISVAIRKSGNQSRSLRGSNYQRVEDGVNLTAYFEEKFLREFIEKRCKLTQKLKDRLFSAIALRRRRFEYQRAHQQRLAYGIKRSHEMDTEQQPLRALRIHSIVKAMPASEFIRASTMKSIIAPSQLPPSTKASDFDPKAMDTRSQSSYRHGMNSNSAVLSRLISIPDPPNVKKLDKYFECPYCCILVSSQKLETRAWRKHVIGDLRPFICLSADCPTPELEFGTEDEWFDHHQSQHALEWWCDGNRGGHIAQSFLTRDELEAHVRSTHDMSFTEPQLQSVLTAAGSPSHNVFDACPFCDFVPPPVRTEASPTAKAGNDIKPITRKTSFPQGTYRTHIANHLLEYFLIALPDRSDIPEHNSATRSADIERSSMRDLGDIQIPSGEQTLNSVESIKDLKIPDTDHFSWEGVYKVKIEREGRYPSQAEDKILKSFIAENLSTSTSLAIGGHSTMTRLIPGGVQKSTSIDERKKPFEHGDQFRNERHSNQLLQPYPIGSEELAAKGELLNCYKQNYADRDTTEESYQGFLRTLNIDVDSMFRVRRETAQRINQTCSWITQKPQFTIWLEGHGMHTLMISAPPGFGKSVLAKYILELVKEKEKTSNQILVLEYFCGKPYGQDTALSIIQSLLYQLLIGRQEIFYEEIQDALSAKPGKRDVESVASWELFARLLSKSGFGTIYAVIDGIDQCNDDSQNFFLNALQEMIPEGLEDHDGPSLRFLLTSRYKEIISGFAQKFEAIEIQREDLFIDHSRYVTSKLQHLSQLQAEDIDEISNMLKSREETFLSLGLILNQLSHQRSFSRNDIAYRLSEMPNTLNGLYGVSIAQFQVDSEVRALSRKLLGILLVAEKSLTVETCAMACADVPVHCKALSILGDQLSEDFVQTVRQLTDSFIVISDTGIISLRASAMEYLTTLSRDREEFSFKIDRCHSILAKQCFQVLLLDNDISEISNKSHGFWEYALKYWPIHLKSANDDHEDFQDLIKLFFKMRPIFKSLLSSYDELTHGFSDEDMILDTFVLHVIVYFDLENILSVTDFTMKPSLDDAPAPRNTSSILTLNTSVDAKDATGKTALMLASERGFSRIVAKLLEQRASVHVMNNDLWTAMHVAAFNNQSDIMDQLVQHGASSESRTIKGETPLLLTSNAFVASVLIKAGADVNSSDEDGNTSLFRGVMNGNIDLVRLLLDAGADLNYEDTDGKSPLHYAVELNYLEIAYSLLVNGASVNAHDYSGLTPLHTAAKLDSSRCIRLLLEHGADVNLKSFSGRTPLYVATATADGEVERMSAVDALLEANADVTIANENGETPLFQAACVGHAAVVSRLISAGGNVNSLSNQGLTPLTEACDSGNVETVKLLLSHGADINFTHENDMPMLQQAIYHEKLEIADLLIEKGIRLDSTCDGHYTPLYVSAMADRVDIARLLLEKGVSPTMNCSDDEGRTILHHFAEFARLELLEDMLSRGLHPDKADGNGWTPLHMAAYAGNLRETQCLIKSGADFLATTNDGFDALLLACAAGHTVLAAFFLELGATLEVVTKLGSNASILAAQNGHLETLEMLVRVGIDLGARTRSNRTALYVAAENGHLPIVKRLLELGEDPNATSSEESSPLLAALSNNHEAVAVLLLNYGANCNIRNAYDFSPVHEAARNGMLDLVKRFLREDCDPTLRARGIWTPLLLAVGKNQLETVRFLIGEFGIAEDSNADLKLIHIAAECGNIDMLDMLLDAGADPHGLHISKCPHSSISSAVRKGHIVVLKRLLEFAVDSDLPGGMGATPIFFAVIRGDLEAVNLLINELVNVNSQDDFGWTPIMLACANRNIPIVKALIKAGADPTIQNEAGFNALDWSLRWYRVFEALGEWKAYYVPSENGTQHSKLTEFVQRTIKRLFRIRETHSLERQMCLQHLRETLFLLEDFDFAIIAGHIEFRVRPGETLASAQTCECCRKEIEYPIKSILFCKTCVLISQCSSCFENYKVKNPLRERGCTDHIYLEIREQDWQKMEPTDGAGVEKENLVMKRLLQDLEEKYGKERMRSEIHGRMSRVMQF